MANKMQTKSKPAKKPKGDASMRAGPNMMPHTGKKDCRCPTCKDNRK